MRECKSMKKICMVVPNPMVKGGIAAVVNGYRGSKLEKDYHIIYVESYKDGGKISKLLKGIRGYFHFAKVLLVDRPDLVHIHSSFGPSFYRKMPFIYMASWMKIPVINHIHGADFIEFYISASDRKKKLIKTVYEKCDRIIALSAEWKSNLSQIVDKEKIEVIENYSVLHKDAYQERQKRSCNNRVLFLGELGRRKGCYDIPTVVEKVVAEVKDARFVLCGAGSKTDENAIRKLLIEKKVISNVEFPGWVRDEKKDRILQNSDVFFLPSYNEGMPMSILDAMGYGLPVVSTNIGGIPKIVHDGENGMCHQPGDTDGFAKSIIQLLLNESMRDFFSKASLDIISSAYSLEVHVEKVERLYDKIMLDKRIQ